MQENTESENPDGSEVPKEADTNSEEKQENDPSSSIESELEFEEHDGEVIQPEQKKNNGCGFFILVLFLLTGGSGYLYYTNQIPTKIMQWVKPITNKLNLPIGKLTPAPTAEKSVLEIEKQNSSPTIGEETSVPEKETKIEIPSASSENKTEEHISGSQSENEKDTTAEPILLPFKNKTEEHISGSQSEASPEVIEPNKNANISGTSTKVEQVKIEEEEKIEEHEEIKDTPTKEPVLSVPTLLEPAPDLEKPSKTNFQESIQKREKERNQAVQAYLDFFEASLLKLAELIKTGLSIGKDFVVNFSNKN